MNTKQFRQPANAHAIKIEALAKLGALLQATPKNVGAKGSKVTGSRQEPVRDPTPTLSELKIDKKTSSLAQQVAALSLADAPARGTPRDGGVHVD